MKLKKLRIKQQILIAFMIFTALIAVLLWFFQIGMLNNFYKMIKYTEIKKTAISVRENVEEGIEADFLLDKAKETGIDILITEPNGELVASFSAFYSVFFTNLTKPVCAGIYNQTVKSGGEYIQWGFSDEDARSDYEEVFYILASTGDNGKLYVLNTRVTPVDSTVETLKYQLWCVTGVMVLLSILLAIFLARRISKPLVNISEKAIQVANGNYETNFEPKGSREIFELSQTLNYTVAELSKLDNLRKELIANVSHDLRTPLTLIGGFAEVMRDIPDEKTNENLQIIIDETERLKNLVSDLLDISKLESGQIEFKKESINLTNSIDNIMSRYNKLVDFDFEFYHGDDVYVIGDELRLSQVIYNLINNAVNYSRDKKVIIVRQILIDESQVRIEIEDKGDGIESDKLPYIWDRYYKVDKNHKQAIIGTGLGLSIVKKILDVHNGTYGVTSTVGVGSTFWFNLEIDKKTDMENNINEET